MAENQPSPDELARRLYDDAEKRTASAMEQLVQSNAFGELLARSTENVMGLTRIGFNTMDLVVRNLRIAGRGDVVRLSKQLARTEDKLERVLQEVEQLRDEVQKERAATRAANNRSRSTSRSRSSSSGGNASNGSSRARKSSSSRSKSS
jgi:uncharacterized membrane protein YgcG